MGAPSSTSWFRGSDAASEASGPCTCRARRIRLSIRRDCSLADHRRHDDHWARPCAPDEREQLIMGDSQSSSTNSRAEWSTAVEARYGGRSFTSITRSGIEISPVYGSLDREPAAESEYPGQFPF